MPSPASFDLEKSITAWRKELARHAGPQATDLRELEAHLREGFAELRGSKVSDEEAFLIALHRVGPPPAVAAEFAKTTPPPMLRSRLFWLTFLGIFGAFAACAFLATPIYQATASLKLNSDANSKVIDPEDFITGMRMMETDAVAIKVATLMTPAEKAAFLAPFKSTNPDTAFLPRWDNNTDSDRNLVDRLLAQRSVSPGHLAYVTEVSIQHPDPKIAATVADDFAEAVSNVSKQHIVDEAAKAVEILQTDARQQKQTVDDLQSQMSTLAEKYGSSDLTPRNDMQPAELQALTATRTADQNTLDLAEAQWTQVKLYQESTPPRDLWFLPFIANDPGIKTLKDNLDLNEAQLTKDRKVFGVNHPDIIALENSLAQSRESLQTASAHIAQTIEAGYLAAKQKFATSDQRLQNLVNAMHQLSSAQLNYDELARQKDSAESMFINTQKAIEDQTERIVEKAGRYEVVDSAAYTIIQTAPKTRLLLFGGLFTGLLTAIFTIIIVRLLTYAFRRPGPPPAEQIS
ncbi:MAG TPA: hypothetical protein VK737_02465 [Opitutales bacterium]|jgi:uncharacterized protein involved in exopolysaccharide biosynthesis|nr:hypothetical protein [Opitutales bacterium]